MVTVVEMEEMLLIKNMIKSWHLLLRLVVGATRADRRPLLIMHIFGPWRDFPLVVLIWVRVIILRVVRSTHWLPQLLLLRVKLLIHVPMIILMVELLLGWDLLGHNILLIREIRVALMHIHRSFVILL